MGAVEAIGKAKQLARRMAAELYAHTPGFLQSLRGKVAILTYHRVVTADELSRQFIQPGMYVTATTFERHVRFLQEHFVVLSLNELLDMWRERTWNPERRYAVITFDDGWLDNYVHAFPILRAYDTPATIFLATGYVGTMKWFWPDQIAWLFRHPVFQRENERRGVAAILKKEHPWFLPLETAMVAGEIDGIIEGCKLLGQDLVDAMITEWMGQLGVVFPEERRVINWAEAQEMSVARVSFGSHSATHRIMTHLDPREVIQETQGSWTAISRQAIETVPVFCYPNGDWSEEVARCVEVAGYTAATTTDFGYEGHMPVHRFGLKRINIHNDVTDTDKLFAFHLAGYNNVGVQ